MTIDQAQEVDTDTMFSGQDAGHMRLALEQAELGRSLGEVPVGAVIADETGSCIAVGFNRTLTDHDPTGHAEIIALRQAAVLCQNHRLPGKTLYVTLEPCVMCLGALLHARVDRIVYGAPDPKTGACGGVISVHTVARLNHQTQVQGGLLAKPCGDLLRRFFHERRMQAKTVPPSP